MAKGSKSQKSKSETQPWAPIRDDLEDQADTARGLYEANPNMGYTGRFIAGQTDQVANARQGVVDFNNAQKGYMDPSISMLQDTIAGKYLGPDSNPWLAASADAAVAPVERHLMRSTIPRLNSQAIAAGAYGGDANGMMKGVAAGDAARSAMEIRSAMYGDNYARERGNQFNAVGALPGAVGAAGLPYERILQDAMLGQDFAQKELDNARMQKEAQDAAPWRGLTNWQNALQPMMGLTSTKSKSTMTSSDPMAGLAGGGMLGAMAGQGLMGSLLAAGPPAAGGLGALALANPWMLPVAMAVGGGGLGMLGSQ